MSIEMAKIQDSRIGRVVTFGCDSRVHVYRKGCGVVPRLPYRLHVDVYHAVMHLKVIKGIDSPIIIIH